ncbi:MAG TPA: hypothetical protein VFD84_18150 [Candidatus Binatia bacterium]|jgi:hypothetical protein|nr:hypothetical protein [Candidatus Binatia bacterium]
MSDGENGWRPWAVVPRLVGGVIALPVVAGFVALGATVVVARSVRELVRGTWAWVPGRRPPDEAAGAHRKHTDSHAA